MHRWIAALGLLVLCSACHSPVPPPATAPQLTRYVGCFELSVTADSASVPNDPFPTAEGRHAIAIPPEERERRFWVYLSPEEVEIEGRQERGLLAVRPRIDPTESSAWRMLPGDTVAIWFIGYGTWTEAFRLRGTADTLSGLGQYASHRGYRGYLTARASRRECPADSLSAADTLAELPGGAT